MITHESRHFKTEKEREGKSIPPSTLPQTFHIPPEFNWPKMRALKNFYSIKWTCLHRCLVVSSCSRDIILCMRYGTNRVCIFVISYHIFSSLPHLFLNAFFFSTIIHEREWGCKHENREGMSLFLNPPTSTFLH